MNNRGVNMDKVKGMVEGIRSKIENNSLLSDLYGASQEEIDHLVKQYGGECVATGIQILETFAYLNQVIGQLSNREQKLA